MVLFPAISRSGLQGGGHQALRILMPLSSREQLADVVEHGAIIKLLRRLGPPFAKVTRECKDLPDRRA